MTFLDKVAFILLTIDILILLGIIVKLGTDMTIEAINNTLHKDEESH